ncbi:Beta-barrel assembly machine subunit BamE [Fontimonas thermophila]|uniref:Outer membrane protein assembly factor BamE n=1 Tax=Fontimonas thermophila TaxID=1076937 RepID=A0A1I2IQN1_9GAMM|nr:outer membrane protein assembly factor BamE [Fontimonas thermophila]SFF44625.1 Beta-barrel assembly machine subunit BamE [Fontimonas thermophila]
MRLLLVLACAGLLTACQLVYKLPTRQGNVIEQKQLDQLKLGMTREQVTYLLGTPLAASPFRTDRWDYVGYYKSPRGKVSKRIVTLYFEQDKLARMEGVEDTSASAGIENPDVKTVIREERKEAAESEREASERDSGVIITPQ